MALVLSVDVLPADVDLVTDDGDAKYFCTSEDLSAYEGTDTGSTPYRIVFTDSSGKTASAYIGALGV